PKAVVSATEGNRNDVVKSLACWIWRPKGNLIDHISKDSGSNTLKRFNYVDPQGRLKIKKFDSGCSRHMTGNKSYLINYQDINGRFVAFGENVKGGKTTIKGKIRTRKLDFEDVYFVKELKFNLFSVLQMCDKKNNVLFTDTECVVLSSDFKLLDESQILLKVPRNNNMYSFDLKNVVPIGGIENQMDHKVKTIRSDNGTEFKNMIMNELYEMKGIGREFSVAMAPQQNGNQTNGNAGTKANINVGQDRIKTVPSTQYVLLPLLTSDSQGSKSSEDEVADDARKKKKERTQRNEFRYLPTDPLIPDLEDTVDTRIFYGAYDDEVEGAVADFNNLELTIVVYRNKKDERGIIVRNKARLVAQGYTQEEGIIKEEVYVCQPPGFEDPYFPNKVYKVEKALYGLHQALRAWYETLSTYLLENGFRRGIIDKTLFIKKDKGDILLVQVYVDDIIFGSTKKSLCIEFKGLMHKKFHMSSIGELTFFLGLQVMQRYDRIFISQDKYVADILKKFDFSSVKTTSTLIETNKALFKDEEAEDVDVHSYRLMIRSLMYLTASRPEIMFAVCACARFQVTPKVSHLHAVKRIFKYLKGQPKLGLWYPKIHHSTWKLFQIVIMLELVLIGNLQQEVANFLERD
nr:putative ribonuclease H-like domain-containing protein [Tanacetum cinerariifolium]